MLTGGNEILNTPEGRRFPRRRKSKSKAFRPIVPLIKANWDRDEVEEAHRKGTLK